MLVDFKWIPKYFGWSLVTCYAMIASFMIQVLGWRWKQRSHLSRISPTPDVCAFSRVTITPLASWIPVKWKIYHKCPGMLKSMPVGIGKSTVPLSCILLHKMEGGWSIIQHESFLTIGNASWPMAESSNHQLVPATAKQSHLSKALMITNSQEEWNFCKMGILISVSIIELFQSFDYQPTSVISTSISIKKISIISISSMSIIMSIISLQQVNHL